MSTTATAPAGSGGSSTAAPTSASATITISNYKFTTPASVTPGETIKVTNKDQVNHTVTASDKAFNVEAIAGMTETFKAPMKPGKYPFICTIHPEMHGVLVVQ